MALATLDKLPPSQGGPADVLCQVEALRMAFAKGLASIVDGAPASVDAHLSEAKAVAAALENLGTDTTYLCCVDAAGNACSFICSNFEAFGSGLVPEGCGFSLQKLVLCGNEISGAPPHAIDATLSLVASDRWRGGSRR